MDGRRGHAQDGIHLAEHDGVFRNELFLAKADFFFVLPFEFECFGSTETNLGRNRRARQHVDPFPEELQLRKGRLVDAFRENLPTVVGPNQFADPFFGNQPLLVQGNRRQQRGPAGQFRFVDLQDGEKVGLSGNAFRPELHGDRRSQAFFQFGKQGVEMVDGRKSLLDLRPVEVFIVFRGQVARHDFFAEDVRVAFYLHAQAGSGMPAVEYARIREVAPDGPYHLLQQQRRVGDAALHEGGQ